MPSAIKVVSTNTDNFHFFREPSPLAKYCAVKLNYTATFVHFTLLLEPQLLNIFMIEGRRVSLLIFSINSSRNSVRPGI